MTEKQAPASVEMMKSTETQLAVAGTKAPPPAGKATLQEKYDNFSCSAFCRKYFWEGQALDRSATKAIEELDPNAPLWKQVYVKHRRILGIMIPMTFFWILWLSIMGTYNYWYVFETKYWMSITMVFGAMFAGATSEGGAAIAFPVMTLIGDVSPSVARDFSFMIQSCGMTAASFAILWMRVKLEWNSLVLCSLGGLVGIIFGLEEVAPEFDPPEKKIFFVCTWFSFAVSLYYINRLHGRKTYPEIPDMCLWKGVALFLAGVAGGIFSSIAGSGIDICSFAMLTLLFRVSEKTATPTSVILMAINTVIGYLYRDFGMNPSVSFEAREYLYACMPIVVLFAPLGSTLGSHFHRLTLAWIVYFVDFVQLIGAYILVDFSNHPCLPWIGVIVVCAGSIVFTMLASYGQNVQAHYEYRLWVETGEIDPKVKQELAEELEIVHRNATAAVEEAKEPAKPFKERTKTFFNKYFNEGQQLTESASKALENVNEDTSLMEKIFVVYRRQVGIAIPVVFFWVLWIIIMSTHNYWYVFKEKYWMSITMIFGSMFAGATSEGGAAIAFPVMTLVGDVSPSVARDFSFMIQSCGMTAASFTIMWMRVQLEWNSIFFCTIGGVIGMVMGLEHVAPKFDPPEKKITFVCTWFAFAMSLYWLNRFHGRKTHPNVRHMDTWAQKLTSWRSLVLLLAGGAGGIFSSMTGSGIDICSFATLTLLFRVSEKVATPTSVVLMAINTVIGYLYRDFGMNPSVSFEAREFLYACMPIVVVGAPLGSILGSHLHRLTLAWIVYFIDTLQLIGAYALVDFSNHECLPYFGWCIVFFGGILFTVMAQSGEYLQVMEDLDISDDATCVCGASTPDLPIRPIDILFDDASTIAGKPPRTSADRYSFERTSADRKSFDKSDKNNATSIADVQVDVPKDVEVSKEMVAV